MYDLIKDWSLEEHSYLRENVPKTGLQTPFRNGTLQDVALKVCTLWHALLSKPLASSRPRLSPPLCVA